jgi:PRTRC genetic system protein E
MFQELMPLLSQRMLILALSRVTDEEVRVKVIPKPLKSEQQSDGSTLTTPLAVTGTPKELDEQVSTIKLGKEPSSSRLTTGCEGGSRAIDHAGHCVD